MWDGDGDKAMDLVDGNGGTLVGGATWAATEKGGVLDFNGSTAGLSLPSTLTGATEFTMAGWINARGAFNTDVIWEHSANFNGSTGSFIVFLTSGELRVSRKTATYYNGGNRADFGNGWRHLAVTWSEVTDGSLCERVWYDGIEQAVTPTHTDATTGVAVPVQTLYMATRATASLHLNCQLGPQAAWNRALSPGEIQQLYVEPHALTRYKRLV